MHTKVLIILMFKDLKEASWSSENNNQLYTVTKLTQYSPTMV